MKITIETENIKTSAEIPDTSTADILVETFFGLMVVLTYHPSAVAESMGAKGEEHLDSLKHDK